MSFAFPPWSSPAIDPQVMSTPASNPFNFHPSFNEYGELQNGERMLQGNAGDPADNASMSCAIAHITNGVLAPGRELPRAGDVVCFKSSSDFQVTEFYRGDLRMGSANTKRAATVINGSEGSYTASIAMHPLSADGVQCGVLVSIEKLFDSDRYVLIVGIEHFTEINAPSMDLKVGDVVGLY